MAFSKLESFWASPQSSSLSLYLRDQKWHHFFFSWFQPRSSRKKYKDNLYLYFTRLSAVIRQLARYRFSERSTMYFSKRNSILYNNMSFQGKSIFIIFIYLKKWKDIFWISEFRARLSLLNFLHLYSVQDFYESMSLLSLKKGHVSMFFNM